MDFKLIIAKLKSSRLFKDSAVYTLLNFSEKAIPFLILPIITRVLSKEEVGIYILYQAIVQILMPLMTLNVDSSILLNFYKVDKDKFREYFYSGFIGIIPVSAILFLLVYSLSGMLSEWIKFPEKWFVVVCLIVLFRFLTQLRQHIWRINYKIKEYGVFTVGISFLKNVSGLLLVLIASFGWEGLVIGHLVGYAFFALVAINTFVKDSLLSKDLRINLTYIKDALSVGYPLSIHSIGNWLGNTVNKVIIARVLGTSATGSYGIGSTFANIVTMTEDAFSKAFQTHLYDRLKDIGSTDKSEIVKLSYYVYAFLILVAFGAFIVGYFGVGLIFGESYESTRVFILPLVIAAMVKGFYKLHVKYIVFTKKTLRVTQITISTGIFNIILAYFMTLEFGIIGTAYSLLIINTIQYLLSFYVGNKLIPMPWLSTLKSMLLK